MYKVPTDVRKYYKGVYSYLLFTHTARMGKKSVYGSEIKADGNKWENKGEGKKRRQEWISVICGKNKYLICNNEFPQKI